MHVAGQDDNLEIRYRWVTWFMTKVGTDVSLAAEPLAAVHGLEQVGARRLKFKNQAPICMYCIHHLNLINFRYTKLVVPHLFSVTLCNHEVTLSVTQVMYAKHFL